jgi:Domain of unknown function (DUF6898)
MPPRGKEIYIEFVVQGSAVKVTAIDPKTGIEASIIGPASASHADLSTAAMRKLQYVLKKQDAP